MALIPFHSVRLEIKTKMKGYTKKVIYITPIGRRKRIIPFQLLFQVLILVVFIHIFLCAGIYRIRMYRRRKNRTGALKAPVR